jgi:hypothetical protein
VEYVINNINWDQANQNWDTFYANTDYAQYILETYGITVPPPYGVLWDHAVEVTVVFAGASADPTDFQNVNKKHEKKKIKLIFMIDDIEKVFEKTKNNTVKIEFKDHIENLLTEKFNQKILLEDVQIIHR